MNGKSSVHLLFLVVVLATFFQLGVSLRCYQCTSRRDSKCSDPISDDLRPTECTRESVSSTLNEITYAVRGSPGIPDIFSGSSFTCLKINSQYNSQFNNMSVLRGCYYDHMNERDICTMLRTKMIDQTTLPFCETCSGDACNGSNRLGSGTSVLSLLLPFCAFYYIFGR